MLQIDKRKGREIAKKLYKDFSTTGVHGKKEMPEDILPIGIIQGSLEHLLFITFSVSIDYMRDANSLWASSRKTYEDANTNYLFSPKALHETQLKQISEDMAKYGLSKKFTKDAYIWRTIGVTFYKKWGGNPINFLEDCRWDALTILRRLRSDTHQYSTRNVPDYPYLRGPKIGPLWLRMLRDNVGITKIKNLEKVPIPVDRHIARATLSTGVVHGVFKGTLNELFDNIRKAWFLSVEDLKVKNRPMIALDVDEALWHLSKYGCGPYRDIETGYCKLCDKCEAGNFCVEGKIVIGENYLEVDT